ncbi:regucalcin-like isoform X2 [Galleria mellonella]|uniref:Regucalcin-like isoform X2 n=1 Tax=Galleria mellonella TaxID=7137 RepID=A0ABM3MRN7_GALME|nr:regucalcin-like isoform X2 [Galleria mellonella]
MLYRAITVLFLSTFYIKFVSCKFSTLYPEEKYLRDISYNVFAYTNLTFTHAESPVWDSETNKLYWVDVLNQDVHVLDYFTWRHTTKHIRTKGPQRGDKVAQDEAALYSLEQPWYTARVKLKPVTISNGLVWALNDSVMYYIDSETRKIEAFDFEVKTGHISNRRTILNIKEYGYNKAIPDGMTIDKDGLLWVALMFEGSVIRIDPESRTIIEKYKLPVSRTTSVTWAGPQLNHLIVTTSRRNISPDELSREPLSGAIFILHQTGTRGVPIYKFAFDNADCY